MVDARVLLPLEVQARPVESLRLAVAVAHAFAQATTPGWLRPVVAWAPLPAWLVFVGAHVLAGGSARLRTEQGVVVLLLEVRGWRYWAAIAGWMSVVVLALAAGARAVLAVAAVAGTWVELAGLLVAVGWAVAALGAVVMIWWRGERGCAHIPGAVRVQALAVWPPRAWPAALDLWQVMAPAVDDQQVVLQASARTDRHAAAYRRLGFRGDPASGSPRCLHRPPRPH